MSSKSLQAEAHRRRQALRAEPTLAKDKDGKPLGVTAAILLHDTVVTNRAEKRAALAVAKRHRCDEVRDTVPNHPGKHRFIWKHSPSCPKWKPEKPKAVTTEAA